jgi:membrane protease YdiL (CAAX protease family)
VFLCFAAAHVVGIAGPVVYTVWFRRRGFRSLGLTLAGWRTLVGPAIVFAGVQFAITLWGYDLPQPVDWVPLLVMALTVGVFESIFFRGFIQGRFEAIFGAAAVAGAAVLYALYHVGYGMGQEEMTFLFGLGIVYAIAYRIGSRTTFSCSGPCSRPSGASSLSSSQASSPECCRGQRPRVRR